MKAYDENNRKRCKSSKRSQNQGGNLIFTLRNSNRDFNATFVQRQVLSHTPKTVILSSCHLLFPSARSSLPSKMSKIHRNVISLRFSPTVGHIKRPSSTQFGSTRVHHLPTCKFAQTRTLAVLRTKCQIYRNQKSKRTERASKVTFGSVVTLPVKSHHTNKLFIHTDPRQ